MAEADGIIARVQRKVETLTQSEARLVAELMRAPREIALATAAEFAARVGVHEATTSRLARKLDFPGYAAFRDALRKEYLHRSEPAHRLSTTLDTAAGDHLGHLIRAEMAALQVLTDHLDQGRIDTVAHALAGRRIFLFAHGHATTLADMAERRLRRMGLDARVLGGNARTLAEGALALAEGDALILFAFRRQPQGYAPLVRLAQKTGVVTLAISDTLGPALSPAPIHLLAAPRTGLEGGFQTLTIPMVVLNALILSISAKLGQAALEPLDRLGHLIAGFEQENTAS